MWLSQYHLFITYFLFTFISQSSYISIHIFMSFSYFAFTFYVIHIFCIHIVYVIHISCIFSVHICMSFSYFLPTSHHIFTVVVLHHIISIITFILFIKIKIFYSLFTIHHHIFLFPVFIYRSSIFTVKSCPTRVLLLIFFFHPLIQLSLSTHKFFLIFFNRPVRY